MCPCNMYALKYPNIYESEVITLKMPFLIWHSIIIILGLSRWLRWERIYMPMLKTQVWSLGWEDPLEEEMATHSSVLAWKIPLTEEHGGLQSTGSQRVSHDWTSKQQLQQQCDHLFSLQPTDLLSSYSRQPSIPILHLWHNLFHCFPMDKQNKLHKQP